MEKWLTSATLCAAMVGGIMVSNGALAVQAEEGEEKEVITLRVMGETGMDGISTDDAVGRYIKEKLGIRTGIYKCKYRPIKSNGFRWRSSRYCRTS